MIFQILIINVCNSQPISSCYLAAYLGCGPSDASCITPQQFNEMTGKKHAFFSKYVDASSETGLLDTALWNWANDLKTPGVCASPIMFIMPMTGLTVINNGNLDVAYSSFANKCLQFNDTMFIIFGHEMNGVWYPWGQQAQEYITAFQHVNNLIKPIAPKVMFCWVPIQAWGQDVYENYYPGDSCVDWVGLNVYDRDWDENNLCTSGFFEAAINYLDFYQTYAAQKNKPMMIAETALFDANWDPTASTIRIPLTDQQQADEKNAWISQIYDKQLLSSIYPNLNLVCYFHVSKMEDFSSQTHNFGNILTDWRIPLDSANNMYSTLISDSYFRGADSCSLSSVSSNYCKNEAMLFQNYPNPFNIRTEIKYKLLKKTKVQLSICQINGSRIQVLENVTKIPGTYQYSFHEPLQSGIYSVQLLTDSQIKNNLLIVY